MADQDSLRWWERAVGYEVYVRSFADADGDGVGDLPGVLTRLEHLADLGVDVVWLTPFYPSPMRDHGYDVSDYTDVEPEFGTLADLDAIVAGAHRLGLRVIVDLVPNHTSSDHPWFRAARSSRDDPHRDFYVWRDGGPDGQPPNNWRAQFGGPAWTFDEVTGQWWLHLFLPEQPDLNWRNPQVQAAFDDILRFWFSRGVDGMRIDVAHALIKHPDLPDNPPDPARAGALTRVHDVDQPSNLDIYRRWRVVADEHDALLLGEVYLLEAERVARYVRGSDTLHCAFWFGPLHVPWGALQIGRALRAATAAVERGLAWVGSSHDQPRAVTRFGGGDVGRRRALAMHVLLAGLPGPWFLYQGEELGLEDVDVPRNRQQDPQGLGTDEPSRDGCRTPMPWEPVDGFGFTRAGVEPWLPFGPRTAADTAAVQREQPASPLADFRRLVDVRRDVLAGASASVEWLDVRDDDVVAYRRGDVVVAANCGDSARTVRFDGDWRIAFASTPHRDGGRVARELELDAAEAIVLQRAAP